MIKIGEVYFDTVLETLFIVDAIGGSRVYLLELKERIDPRVVIEKPETIFKRYKLTNIGRDNLDNASSTMEYPIKEQDLYVSMSTSDAGVKLEKRDPVKGSTYNISKESTFGIRVKDITPKKAAPKKAAPKKVTKKLIKKPNKK